MKLNAEFTFALLVLGICGPGVDEPCLGVRSVGWQSPSPEYLFNTNSRTRAEYLSTHSISLIVAYGLLPPAESRLNHHFTSYTSHHFVMKKRMGHVMIQRNVR
jgi:hypothetical protein